MEQKYLSVYVLKLKSASSGKYFKNQSYMRSKDFFLQYSELMVSI